MRGVLCPNEVKTESYSIDGLCLERACASPVMEGLSWEFFEVDKKRSLLIVWQPEESKCAMFIGRLIETYLSSRPKGDSRDVPSSAVNSMSVKDSVEIVELIVTKHLWKAGE